jgi:hypothetical protein
MRCFFFSMLLLSLLALGGCGLPDWQPKKPYLDDYQFSSDQYTQDKWAR